jgi:peptidoglycan hydrolase FlgJ
MELGLTNPPPFAGEVRQTSALSPAVALRATARPQAGEQSGKSAEMRQIAEQFEAMVLAELFAPMFSALDTDGLGGGGAGERMFRPMLVQQYAEAMSHAGGIGLADSIMRELTGMQAQAAQEPPDGADR